MRRVGRGKTHVEDHVADDFIIGDEGRMLFLCGQEAVHEIFLVFELREVRHAIHELLDCKARGDGEVVELVEPRQMRILAEQLVERGYLSNLRMVNRVRGHARGSTYNREVSHYVLSGLQHSTDIFTLLHEAHTLAPGHVAKEVPSEVRDPVSDVTCLAAIVALHESAFELTTKDTQVLIHKWLQL